MKRCWFKSTFFMVLVLTSLLFASSCGLPTYLSLDGDVTLSRDTSGIDGSSINANVDMSTTAAAKLVEAFPSGSGPSIKLFYVLSSSSNYPTAPITGNETDTGYTLGSVETVFESIYRTDSGNGRIWTPIKPTGTDATAPGFYLYTNTEETERSTSIARPTDLATETSGILMGTFANHSSASDIRENYQYGASPVMDIPIVPTNFTTGFGFTIEKEVIDPSTASTFPVQTTSYLLKLTTDETPARTWYLTDYRKHAFIDTNTWSSDEFNTQYVDNEDAYFYANLSAEYGSTIYLHVYGAVFAGEGNFTNIYWSNLKYLGYIGL